MISACAGLKMLLHGNTKKKAGCCLWFKTKERLHILHVQHEQKSDKKKKQSPDDQKLQLSRYPSARLMNPSLNQDVSDQNVIFTTGTERRSSPAATPLGLSCSQFEQRVNTQG